MSKDKKEFAEFKKKTQHPKEELLAILTINPITVRVAYFIKKFNLGISPTIITLSRLLFFAPLAILSLFLAPILREKIFYLIAPICIYFMAFTDDLDGTLARGLKIKSNFGAFLDSISDRAYTLILIIFIFSVGMWINSIFLIYGALLILTIKSFHLMIISKVFYYSPNLNVKTIFPDFFQRGNIIMVNLNKILKIKRWCENFGGFERIFLTVMLPSILFYLNFEFIVLIMVYVLAVFNLFFYISRIKKLLLEYRDASKD